ncbi:hypothetical protein [Flavobacterium aquidurense]|uniref:Lipoprotein n=1 Tax=Flavobacterium aquidurense TaxID=362413 RepID=A0A0Q0RMH9_9FLAO|nr:hypothetical protein [Flavobacterium aquidurense]KQB37157.1 hypothetical protein RC62_2323 [Flavobacterium aquidurense]
MKNFKFKTVFVVLFSVTVLVSCSNDDKPSTPEPTTKIAFVTEVKGPVAGKVNEELSYDVTFIVDNACGEFNKITEATIGIDKGLQVEAKYASEVCTQQVPDPKKTVYKFKSTAKGTFEIKFKKSDKEFVTTKVVIE